MRIFAKYWLPVALWMLLIFLGSTDTLSVPHTSRVLGPLLRWLYPAISDAAIQQAQLLIRKSGHMAEYAVLALLLWRARRKPARADRRPWSTGTAAWTLTMATAYACSDEFHQSFVPSRGASGWDVLLDVTGAALGLGALWLLGKYWGDW